MSAAALAIASNRFTRCPTRAGRVQQTGEVGHARWQFLGCEEVAPQSYANCHPGPAVWGSFSKQRDHWTWLQSGSVISEEWLAPFCLHSRG